MNDNFDWESYLAGISPEEIQNYVDYYGITPDSFTDPKIGASLVAAKQKAASSGNSGFEKVADKVLMYSDKILTILSKTGVIKNQNLASAGYVLDTSKVDTMFNNAPTPTGNTGKFLGLDLTDPKTLIIIALIAGIAIYFIARPSDKRRR